MTQALGCCGSPPGDSQATGNHGGAERCLQLFQGQVGATAAVAQSCKYVLGNSPPAPPGTPAVTCPATRQPAAAAPVPPLATRPRRASRRGRACGAQPGRGRGGRVGCKPGGEGGQGPPAGQGRSMCEEHGEAQGQQLLLLPSKLLLRSGRPGSSRPWPAPAASPALLQLALHVAPLQPLHAAPQREAPGARLRLASRVLPSKAARVHSDRY